MKKMSRILSSIFVVIALFAMTSCFEKKPKKIYISEFSYGIVENAEDTMDDKIKGNLNAGQAYYLLINIAYNTEEDTSGADKIDAELKLNNVSVIEGNIEEANSSEVDKKYELSFFNSQDGTDATVTTISFMVPEKANDKRYINMTVRLTPNFTSTTNDVSDCAVNLSLKTRDNYTISDSKGNGRTFSIHVVRSVLQPVEIAWDASKMILSWKHVKNAGVYAIMIGEDEVAEVKINASTYAEGSEILYTELPLYVLYGGVATVRVAAYGENRSRNFISSVSNSLDIDFG